MMTKNCPACGCEMSFDVDRCPDCGMEGLNPLFLSKDAYEAWVERTLVPHLDKIKPPQVFLGPHHGLILMGSGDLYAIGNNSNDACGSQLPRELTTPTRIARGVKHAAAGKNHTAYVTLDGEVKLIGNSDLTERFECSIRAERVFAFFDKYYIEDEDGKGYFFGDNHAQNSAIKAERTSQVLREYPPYTVRTVENGIFEQSWWSRQSCPEHFSVISRDSGEIMSVWDEIEKSEWYRDLVRKHGEKNIIPEDKLLDRKRELCKEEAVEQYGDLKYATDSVYRKSLREYEEVCTYQPRVLLENRMIND